MDDDFSDDAAFDEEQRERERILRERGYDPRELTIEEQDRILTDSLDDDAENDRLGNVMPADERDNADA